MSLSSILWRSSLASTLLDGVVTIVFSLFFSLKSRNLLSNLYSSGSSNLFETLVVEIFGFLNCLELDCFNYCEFFLEEFDRADGLYSVLLGLVFLLNDDSVSLSKLSFLI